MDRCIDGHDGIDSGKTLPLEQIQAGRTQPRHKRRTKDCQLIRGHYTSCCAAGLDTCLRVSYFTKSPPPVQSLTFTIEPPEGVRFQTARLAPPVLSPDGTQLAFAGVSEEGSALWIRPLDSLTPERLPGTEGAEHPFWSPDSRFLGFFAGGKLKKIDVIGGPPQTLPTHQAAAAAHGPRTNKAGVSSSSLRQIARPCTVSHRLEAILCPSCFSPKGG